MKSEHFLEVFSSGKRGQQTWIDIRKRVDKKRRD